MQHGKASVRCPPLIDEIVVLADVISISDHLFPLRFSCSHNRVRAEALNRSPVLLLIRSF
jgi:hypothetical protein